MTILIEAADIDKSFGAVHSLRQVSINGRAGSVHAVTGENGAGKSTLMKVIAGVLRPDRGTLRLRGAEMRFRSPLDATRAGISTVFQEFSLVPNLSVAETLWLGREPHTRLGFVDRTALRDRTRTALAQVGLDIDPRRLVGSLTVAEQQAVEIAKGLAVEADVFILDEPTAALNATEVGRLEALVARLKAEGKCVFYISHRMREIFDLCDTVTVLKDGRLVTSLRTADTDPRGLLNLMVGRDVHQLYPPRQPVVGDTVLSVRGLKVTAAAPPVSFELRTGEIVALAGLEGQGQREIIRSLAGVVTPVAGQAEVRRAGAAAFLSFGTAARAGTGVAFMPEDRKSEGLYLSLSVHDNVALGAHQTRGMWRVARGLRELVGRLVKDLAVKTADTGTPVLSLSGGNQQKVMLARWLASGARILLIEEPTRGVDVGAKAELYAILRRFVTDGGSILVTSRELLEAIGMSDRILVVKDFGIVAELPAATATEESILHAAAGLGTEAAQQGSHP